MSGKQGDLGSMLSRITGKVQLASEAFTAEQAELERQEQIRANQQALTEAGVPKRLLEASLQSPLQTAALIRAREYVATDLHDGRALILCGPPGCGKTFALAAILGALPGWLRRFWYFPGLCSALLDPATRRDALESARRTRLVVFDDFGVEYLKPGGLLETMFDDIVWHREAEALPTLISTNLKPHELRERLGERIMDRLADWAVVVPVHGESLRGRERRPGARPLL